MIYIESVWGNIAVWACRLNETILKSSMTKVGPIFPLCIPWKTITRGIFIFTHGSYSQLSQHFEIGLWTCKAEENRSKLKLSSKYSLVFNSILFSLVQFRVQGQHSSFGPKQNTKVTFNHHHHPPKTFKVVPGKLGPQNFVWTFI